MAENSERNDRRGSGRKPFPRHVQAAKQKAEDVRDWLWGRHAVEAALSNPSRPAPRRVLATRDRATALEKQFGRLPTLEVCEAAEIAQRLPQGAVHQGMALKIDPPEPTPLAELAAEASGVLLMLDQLTDPQNVGTIFRSAAAFGARGVILQDRNTPALNGTVAKAAVGAIDKIPHALVTNLSRALEELEEAGWRAVGLSGEAEAPLDQVLDGRPIVLVLGSEAEGLRRLVAEHCDVLARIEMAGGFESLNVSAAAAVALYEATRKRG
ncbi:MAG: methyltransferase, TrmH family, group 3 [Caulobacteraceae bacterium]|nr:methyltransferase, TrmH family, group 3 [Caulobacteraceae bacterium]